MNIQLEHLDLLPQMMEEIKNIKKELQILKQSIQIDLTKRSGVKQYLNISDSTISVMMKDGRLKQNIHYIKEIKGNKTKITFIESAIKNLKGVA